MGVYIGSFRATYLAFHSQWHECVVLKWESQGSGLGCEGCGKER
ncbi:MAG: hypothetical protein ACFE75_07720 [Candidatus Hodarchaeota archaeon]